MAVLAFALGAPTAAHAIEVGESEAGVPVQVHGFVSQGYLKSWGNNYLAATKRTQGSFKFTEIGINFTVQPTERLRVGLQLFARDLGPGGNYNAKMDWLMLDYRWRDWFGIRAGRVKLPFGLYNDTSDIDAARVPVLLPVSVYPVTNRNFYLAQSGFELYGYLSLGGAGALDYRAYGGSINIEIPSSPGASVQATSFDNTYLVGARLLWETPVDGLRAGGSIQPVQIEIGALAPQMVPPMTGTLSLTAVLWLWSVEYAANDWLVAAEYGRTWMKSTTTNPMVVRVIPMSTATEVVRTSESGYVMLARRLRRWLQPGVYASVSFPDVDHRADRRDQMQLDGALSVRFDINPHWLFKLEGHAMRGTAAVQPALNGNVGRDLLTKDWVVILAKTTAYF
jgi:hypothetical protein